MADYVNAQLKGISKFGNSTLIDNLKDSVTTFFDWATLETEAFFNVNYPAPGPYGGDYTVLSPVHDPNYVDGTVWEGKRSNWVWEKDLSASSYQPIQISGVYVNNTFVPASSTGVYAHTINYLDGRVIFNNPVATSSNIHCNHSFKYFNWSSSDAPWFREVIFDTFRPDMVDASGKVNIMQKNRINMPAIIVEVAPARTMEPYSIPRGQWVRQDVKFHIYAESTADRDKLVDIITYQKDRNIVGYDRDKVFNSGMMPLTYPGNLTGTTYCYPDYIDVNNAFWKRIFMKNMRWENGFSQAPYFFYDVVRATCEIVMEEI